MLAFSAQLISPEIPHPYPLLPLPLEMERIDENQSMTLFTQ